jgi:hypothetical protein
MQKGAEMEQASVDGFAVGAKLGTMAGEIDGAREGSRGISKY